MPVITKQKVDGMAVSPGYSVVTWSSIGGSSTLRISGNETLLFRGAGTATIVSVPDQLGRTKDITFTPGSEIVVVGPVLLIGFQQADFTLAVLSSGSVDVAILSMSR